MTKQTYADLMQMSATDLLHALTDRLPSLWNEAARSKEYADLAGDDFDPVAQRQEEISHLIGRLKRAHADLGELRTHRHQWGENDYCLTCGADGRA